MLLKYFYDSALAHASYVVGCQKTGDAIVIDPGRDVEQYLTFLNKQGMRLVAAADTHIHADYVSGARELAHINNVKLFLSDEGPTEWKYLFVKKYEHQLLKHEDVFKVGNIEFEVLHTPGHTPESLSFLVTDKGGGADKPMGLFTGDFVFVGSIGRPDLLEEAAGIKGSAETGARSLFQSVKKFKDLPDYLQVWPAHGSGSACGKGLGAIPSSTVGYEKMFNPALQLEDEQTFVDYILSEQPEAPRYFEVMKKVNKEGPSILGKNSLPDKISPDKIVSTACKNMVIDTISSKKFAKAHVNGTVNIPLNYLAAWAGWLVDYDSPVYLIVSMEELPEAVRIMRKIGIEKIGGYFDESEIVSLELKTQAYQEVAPLEIEQSINSGDAILIDVRGNNEWKERHIKNAQRCFLGNLPQMLKKFDGDCTLVFHCRGGGRSAIATSIAKANDVKKVLNLKGGINAWVEAGLPVVNNTTEVCGPNLSACTHEVANQGQAIFWNAQCSAGKPLNHDI